MGSLGIIRKKYPFMGRSGDFLGFKFVLQNIFDTFVKLGLF